MQGLTSELLGRACRIFLRLAYEDGAIPVSKRLFADISADQPLEKYLLPPVYQAIPSAEGKVRKLAFRLGSAAFPHLKLQVTDCGNSRCVFGVDTHDLLELPPDHPDATRWRQIKESNRKLKEAIELAWEEEGLTTFNTLLRDGLEDSRPSDGYK